MTISNFRRLEKLLESHELEFPATMKYQYWHDPAFHAIFYLLVTLLDKETMTTETRHRPFNPTPPPLNYPSPLSNLCASMEDDGWRLVSIIPSTQYEHIAVFQRNKSEST